MCNMIIYDYSTLFRENNVWIDVMVLVFWHLTMYEKNITDKHVMGGGGVVRIFQNHEAI